jgi:hypothetical protein
MKPIGAKPLRWRAWLGPALMVMFMCSLPAVGAERRVLVEEFTHIG